MSLLKKVAAAGGRVYDGVGTPLWDLDPNVEVEEITLGDQPDGSVISVEEGEYGPSLRVVEGKQAAYIPIVGDMIEGCMTFRVGNYIAARDYAEADIYEGDQSLRAACVG